MTYLVDTSVLGRLADILDAYYPIAVRAVSELHRRGESLCIAPQNLVELRNFSTRPTAVNGLGFSVAVAELKASLFESYFSLIPETPAIFPAWKNLAHGTGVIGKQVRDARLVAVCHVHGVTHLLTFNVSHFTRFSSIGPGIVVVDPANV
jgi:predicted nucleic acid-binding protein